jgi:hypothetical protein
MPIWSSRVWCTEQDGLQVLAGVGVGGALDCLSGMVSYFTTIATVQQQTLEVKTTEAAHFVKEITPRSTSLQIDVRTMRRPHAIVYRWRKRLNLACARKSQLRDCAITGSPRCSLFGVK